MFRENPFAPLLKTHKLKGRLRGIYSFSVDSRYRIIFVFYKQDVIFLDIGDHTVYQ